jgi:hypothetical protein
MFSKRKSLIGFIITTALLLMAVFPVTAAYKAHNNDADVSLFLQAYPSAAGTKLDNCYLCHTGSPDGKKDSCDYCHSTYGFSPPHGDILSTLNSYGLAYYNAAGTPDPFVSIAGTDSDKDNFTNEEEILAGRLPGDSSDYPGVAEAPAKTYDRSAIRKLPKVTQFMAVDTAKSGDFFAEYSGVDMWTLLLDAGISDDAYSITVYAADGYSKSFQVSDLKEDYEQGIFLSKYPWISFPLSVDYKNGKHLPGKINYLLAYEREGFPLQESKIVVDGSNKYHLDGEGPYRFVTPLTEPVVPDRSAWSIDRDNPPYPYNPNRPVIRNGDNCIKVAVAIKVISNDNPKPQYDWNGRAWEMVEKGELVVYGAINPK